MVRITEELVRKRAEHNDGEMFSLEEVSLHQQDIQKIQHLEQWCRQLRILYLQNNLISTIENVGKLKKLEYLNLALNNIELIENLEGCESLQKLDLTVNFVGRLSSVQSLAHNVHLRELFLVGNPCADFQGYREYVVNALPQLQFLDGAEISRSERLRAAQGLDRIRAIVHQQEEEYVRRREREKEEEEGKKEQGEKEEGGMRGLEEAKKEPEGNERRPGFDGRWYTDISSTHGAEQEQQTRSEQEQAELDFWQTPCSFTPESRLATHRHLEERRRGKDTDAQKKAPPPRTLITADGRVLNANEPKLDFCLTEDEENNTIVLDLAVYRHLDTSLIDVDIQPSYARVLLKGKVFQMVLPAEVKPDASTAQRSQSTGHLVLTMPRAEGEIRVKKKKKPPVPKQHTEHSSRPGSAHERLEVDSSALVDFTNIVQRPHSGEGPLDTRGMTVQSEPSVSPGFVDDPDVPPLM